MSTEPQAQVKISCRDLNTEAQFFEALGFRILQVFPADNPRRLVLQGFGLVLRLEKGLPVNDLTLVLPHQGDQQPDYSPSGVNIQYENKLDVNVNIPESLPFTLTKFEEDSCWVEGRAAMQYRDLLPHRLSGAMIASHIRIPQGGPVADQVHFHHIQFQLIFCVKGWVKLVYEDQGEPFVLAAGDCVTQPPGIRHRVLEASEGLEVVEIGLPAEHMTVIDHPFKLPTGQHLPERTYVLPQTKEQRFSHHQQQLAQWQAWQHGRFQRCKTAVKADSFGLAALNVIKANESSSDELNWQHHDVLRFYYLMSGEVKLMNNDEPISLYSGDCFLSPANHTIQMSEFSAGFQCFEFILIKR